MMFFKVFPDIIKFCRVYISLHSVQDHLWDFVFVCFSDETVEPPYLIISIQMCKYLVTVHGSNLAPWQLPRHDPTTPSINQSWLKLSQDQANVLNDNLWVIFLQALFFNLNAVQIFTWTVMFTKPMKVYSYLLVFSSVKTNILKKILHLCLQHNGRPASFANFKHLCNKNISSICGCPNHIFIRRKHLSDCT